jgi:hypothetical protein
MQEPVQLQEPSININAIPKIIFIVPYRDREQQKEFFMNHMKTILSDIPQTDYKIFFSHQMDTRDFNRGAIKNIGFLAMKEKYPNDYKNITFVFNDIDTIPAAKNTFNYITSQGTVKHFYGFIFALGGIFSITGEDFEKCNGFPNNWGWGLEDNAMHDRVLLNELRVDRTQFFPLNSKEIIHLHDTPIRLINNKEPNNYIQKNFRDNLSNIYELDYSIDKNSVSDTQDDTRNKVSSLIQNEYIINIHNFRTLVNPANEIFYNQNTFYNTQLRPNVYETSVNRNRWKLRF